SGGPQYRVPLGRRDRRHLVTREDTINNIPSPRSTARQLIDSLRNKGLDATDVVALSGGHTIGRSLCTSFTNRLYPNQDPTMDQCFAQSLKRTCPTVDSNGTVMFDVQTPNLFDNRYYINLKNRQGLFTSDQDLYMDSTTRPIVTRFAENQRLFFERFTFSMIKMGMMNVTTGTQGEIRANCSRRNAPYRST
ncbi:Peroxidase, partial [Thalictrum thalictroides]